MKYWQVVRILWGAVIVASSSAVHAYTVNECTEKWYPQAKAGQEIYELHPEKTVSCGKHNVNMKSDRLGEIGGNGYLMTDSKSETYACPRVGSGVGIPIPACVLPKAFQRDVVHETRKYYLLTPHGADLRPLGESGYSTDGRTVFVWTTPINGADPASFQPFDTTNADGYQDWARDRDHIYYDDTPMPDMVIGEIEFVGPFVINDGRVFEVGLSEVDKRPDVLPTLKLLAADAPYYRSLVSDGRRIYLGGKVFEGLDGGTTELLYPTCPVPGHPDLSCREGGELITNGSTQFRLTRVGNDVVYFRGQGKTERITDVPDFVYFQPKNKDQVFGMSAKRLFNLSGYGPSQKDSFEFVGRIRGPVAGALVDERGFLTGFGWSDMKMCFGGSDIPLWPESNGSNSLGTLRQLPDAELPEGFAVALENDRYRYLFASRDKRSPHDTVIDLRDGRRMLANCQ
ncbi:DKNYY domain-containing protein [Pseudomonas syringae]|nr:DKNYY domain-containing protein [Pseudomonas syringae]